MFHRVVFTMLLLSRLEPDPGRAPAEGILFVRHILGRGQNNATRHCVHLALAGGNGLAGAGVDPCANTAIGRAKPTIRRTVLFWSR